MKALSQSEYGELRSLYESVYAPKTETILEGFTDEDLDLTDEYIEEQVEELFLECIEEGYEVDEIERAICEAIDAELEILNEVTNPAKVAALRTKNKASAAAGEGSGDAGAKARLKLNVSRQKVSGSSEKKASTLSRVKGAVKKVAKGVQGGIGLAARAVGTAQRASSAVKSAAKSGYERGKQGPAGDSSSSTSSASGPSASSSSSSLSKSARKAVGKAARGVGSLLKKGLKKVVGKTARAVSKGTDKVAKRMSEEIEALKATGKFSDKEIAAILESENQVDEAMSSYDRNRKRAAQRAADRNAARAAGKTGVVPGVGYVSPRKEKETYVDSAGTTRHKSGAKMPKD